MNCLHCNKILDTKDEQNIGWHKRCIKKFFNTTSLPEISITENDLNAYFNKHIDDKMTITGAQKKMSLNLVANNEKTSLSLVDYPTGFILKPQVKRYPLIPQAEHLVMSMADLSKLNTVPHALIKLDDEYAYITKRIDRIFNKNEVKKIAMEDFCQLDMRLTEEKYNGSYERCSKIIKKYSSRSNLDNVELFMRIVLCFIVGNSDMHLKNFSLIEINDNYVLSSAYDLVPVNILIKEDQYQTALTLNGKKKNITKKDLIEFGLSCEINIKVINNIFLKFANLKNNYLDLIESSLLSSNMKIEFKNLICNRLEVLSV